LAKLDDSKLPSGKSKDGRAFIPVRYISKPFHGPRIADLKKNEIFKKASFLVPGVQATIYELSTRQGSALKRLISGHVPASVLKQCVTTSGEKAVQKAVRTFGGGFGSPEQNRRAEKMAIREATALLQCQGWDVHSVEAEKVGYDLHCERKNEVLRVEVKGVRGGEPSFMLTASEYDRSQTEATFALCVVTAVLKEPKVRLVTQPDLKTRLRKVRAIAFSATLGEDSVR